MVPEPQASGAKSQPRSPGCLARAGARESSTAYSLRHILRHSRDRLFRPKRHSRTESTPGVRDATFGGTALGWAEHLGRDELARRLAQVTTTS